MPVVVVAMTRQEAKTLFKGRNDNKGKKLLDAIKNLDLQDIQARYDSKRRDFWRPFGFNQDSIKTILNGFAKEIELHAEDQPLRIEFEFNTEMFFKNDTSVWNQVLDNLKARGCLFVIDSLSLFHSAVFDRFGSCTKGDEEYLMHFFMSPIDPKQIELHKLVEEKVKSALGYFVGSYETKLSFLRGFYIGNAIDLNRNLKAGLKEFGVGGFMLQPWNDKYKKAGIKESGVKVADMFYK